MRPTQEPDFLMTCDYISPSPEPPATRARPAGTQRFVVAGSVPKFPRTAKITLEEPIMRREHVMTRALFTVYIASGPGENIRTGEVMLRVHTLI